MKFAKLCDILRPQIRKQFLGITATAEESSGVREAVHEQWDTQVCSARILVGGAIVSSLACAIVEAWIAVRSACCDLHRTDQMSVFTMQDPRASTRRGSCDWSSVAIAALCGICTRTCDCESISSTSWFTVLPSSSLHDSKVLLQWKKWSIV